MTKRAEDVGPVGRARVRLNATVKSFADSSSRRDHRRIFKSLLWVTVLLLIAKLASVGREILVAHKYGVSPAIDAYSLLLTVVGLPVSLFNNILVVTVLPLFTKMAVEAPANLRQFQREAFGATLVLGIVISCGVAAWCAYLLAGNVLGLTPISLAASRDMVGPLLLLVPLGVLNSLLAVQLMARRRASNSLLDGVPALGTILAVSAFSALTPAPLIWGMIAGTMMQTILLIFAQDRMDALRWPSVRFQSPVWKNLLGGVLWILLSQIVLSFVDFIDQTMVVSTGSGANAEFGYANRMLSLPFTLGVTAIIRVLLPALAEIRGRGDSDKYAGQIAAQWAIAVFAAGCLALTIGWFVTPWFVRLVYQHGAFTVQDTHAVVAIIRAGLVRMPVYFGGVVVAQFIASQAEYSIYIYIAAINTMSITIKLVANYFLIKLMGAPGAMISTAIMYAFSMIAMIVLTSWMPSSTTRYRKTKQTDAL